MKTPPVDGINETSPRVVEKVESSSCANWEENTRQEGGFNGCRGWRLLREKLYERQKD